MQVLLMILDTRVSFVVMLHIGWMSTANRSEAEREGEGGNFEKKPLNIPEWAWLEMFSPLTDANFKTKHCILS